jgi:parvulin-like peptidyl-prolyl isomerase
LEIGEISDVVTSQSGYYILRREDKGDNSFAFSYVFIKAQTLDDYIIQETNNIKMWSFADF